MSVYIEKSAKTVEQAIDLALAELQADMDEVDCQIITAGSKGFMGVGSRDAKVRVARLKDIEAEKQAAEAAALAAQVAAAEQAKQVAQATSSVADANEEKAETKTSFFSRKEKKATVKEEEAVATAADTETAAAAAADGLLPSEAVTAAQQFLAPVFEALKVAPECRIEEREGVLWLIYSGKGLGCVIGRRGETLDALQYLTNLAVGMKLGKDKKYRVVLDVEGYRENRNETLAALAERMAAKVKKTGRDVVLEPMSPHERRIIHMTLQDRPGIRTYSQGEEPYRKVVITRHK